MEKVKHERSDLKYLIIHDFIKFLFDGVRSKYHLLKAQASVIIA